MKRYLSCILAFWICAAVIISCSKAPYTGRRQLILFSDGQMTEMSLQFSRSFQKESEISNNKVYNARVREIAGRIVEATKRDDVSWRFFVVEDDETLNAFALPNGDIYVYTGMIKLAQTDTLLSTVIGHEIGHVVAKHGAERASTAQLTQIGMVAAGGFLGGGSSAQIVQLAANFGILLPHSRTQEYEADRIGLTLMAQAGYNPDRAVDFWTLMSRQSKGQKPPEFLSTHPADENRINAIRELLPAARAQYRPR
jgi:predicted Zn-dependent protease